MTVLQIPGWVERNMAPYSSRENKHAAGSVMTGMALLLPIFILVLGMVIDIGRSLAYKAELSKACMVAAEEATKTIDMITAQGQGINKLDEKYRMTASDFFYANIEDYENAGAEELEIEVFGAEDDPRSIEVRCTGSSKCFFLKIIGISDVDVTGKAIGRLRRIK